MQHPRRNPAALAFALLTGLGVSLTPTGPARAEFPQTKINFVDTSEAPKIKVWASVAKKKFVPPGDKDLTGVTLSRKPDKTPAQELFSFEAGEIVWPKSLSEEEKKKKEATPPELALAADLDKGSAVVVLVPGFQDPEYKDGTLGERSRNGAGLFFKKLGKNNMMNVVWYTDFIMSYVHTEGRTTSLSKLESELENCAKWERQNLKNRGLSPDELAAMEAEAGPGAKKGEAVCGLTKEYGEFGKILQKTAYDGFYPQLFGLQQKLCVKPEHDIKRTGMAGEGDDGAKRMSAIDAALEMLAKHPDPSMPKVLILTGDGRDGYINATSDCRAKYQLECQNDAAVQAATGPERRDKMNSCVKDKLKGDIAVEQGSFLEKLPTWLGLAKAANIRIYSVIHPTALEHTRERLEVLAWRTGGTALFARDANEVGDLYEQVIAEINNQVVLTFVDEEATPGSEVAYLVEARGLLGPGGTTAEATSEPFKAKVPPAIERSTVNEIKSFGQKKLGKTGFMAALIGVGALLLVLLFKIVKKVAGAGKDAGAKGMKAAQGAGKGKMDAAAKAKAKAIEKAKKAKELQKKAMEKAKKG